MKKHYTAIIEGKSVEFDFEKTGDATARLVVDGKESELDIAHVGPHDYSVLVDGKSYDIDLVRDKGKIKAAWQGDVLEFKLLDEKAMRRAGGAGASEGVQSGSVTTPMPGKVVKIHVTLGQVVKIGDGIVVVEAMKMENEFKAPKDGIVKKISANVGDSVEGGQVLVVIE